MFGTSNALIRSLSYTYTKQEESFEVAVISSETEIQIVANLLHISADLLQKAITHRITVSSFILFLQLTFLPKLFFHRVFMT